MGPLDQPRRRVRAVGHGDQVNVVGHPAATHHVDPAEVELISEQILLATLVFV